ncbi:unnamed protein product [Paramecium pentaurelia]|uniref:Uncharacterized protein n=1 Tax=Paramecium pentaurelia TaxID=43138 RepID=A0A8S1THA9_9CILI|nr:unnamed protein product [Paramecium pentaurelia]
MINPNRKQIQGSQFYQCFLKEIDQEMLHQQYNKKNILKIKFDFTKRKLNLDIQHQKNKINHFKLDYQIFQQYLRVQKINFLLHKFLLEWMNNNNIHLYKIGIQNLIPYYVVLQENSVKLKNKNYSINHLVQKNNKK